MKRILTVAAMLGASLWSSGAWAQNTAANTQINNRATVNYSVGSVAQTEIESSPTGNSTPGAGAGTNTTFRVDDKIDLTVDQVGASPVVVSPGQLNQLTPFTVTNTGNAPHAYGLLADNVVGGTVFGNTDNAQMGATFEIFVDSNGNNIYEPGTDNQVNILSLAAGASVRVFVLADAPLSLTNGQFASVRLVARAAENNNPANFINETTTPDDPNAVDFVFADAATAGSAGTGPADLARDGRHSDDHQYTVQSAALTVEKDSLVVSDPFNNATNPKAIPGAIVEYTVRVANAGATPADAVEVLDPIPANTTFQQNVYSANTRDVRITVNGVDSFCVAEAGGTDTNGDGCRRNNDGSLRVVAPALPASISNVAPNNEVFVRFQVAIN